MTISPVAGSAPIAPQPGVPRVVAPPRGPVADRVSLNAALAAAALERGFLRQWAGPAVPGAAEYALARTAALSGEGQSAIESLRRAILANPDHLVSAARDSVFTGMEGQVRHLVERLTAEARFSAESAIAAAASEVTRLDETHAAEPARNCLLLAQAYLESCCYTGYVAAAEAAFSARRVALETRDGRARLRPWAWATTGRYIDAVRGLWRKAPLLVLLYGWFLAGAAAGLLLLPFHTATSSLIRDILFCVWAVGLLIFVVAGFFRSVLLGR